MTTVTIQPDADSNRSLIARARSLLGPTSRHGLISLLDQAVFSGTRFVTTFIVGRACGPDELGFYSLAFSLMVMTTCVQESLISMPYTIYGVRLLGRPRKVYAASTLFQHGLLSVAAMLVLLVVAVFASWGHGPPGLAPVMATLAFMMPFSLLRDLARRFSFAHTAMWTVFILDCLVAALQMGSIVVLACFGKLSAVTACVAIGAATGAAALLWLGVRRDAFRFQFSELRGALRRNWGLGKWVFASQVTSAVNGNLMYWLIAVILGATATGRFSASLSIILFANPFILGFSNVLSPRVAKAMAEGGSREVRRVVDKSILLLSGIMALFTLLVVVAGGFCVTFIYGQEYTGLGYIVAAVAFSTLANAVSMPAGNGLWVMERADVIFFAYLLGLITTVVLSAVLLAPFQILGAALAHTAGAIVAAVVSYIAYRRLPHREAAAIHTT